MSITYSNFSPHSTITVNTWRGDTYQLEPDLFSWFTQKSMSQGTFNIQLVPRRPWDQLIQPQDYVEIRAAKEPVSGELPIIMRGFVDSASINTQMGTTGGPGEPRIIISGTDYTKLLTMWQILYLWTQNTFKPGNKHFKQNVVQASGFGLYGNFKIPTFSPSINAYMHTAFNNLVGQALKNLSQQGYKTFEDLTPKFSFPNYPVDGFNVASYTGSYWNLFEYITCAPFGELFVRDVSSGPEFVGRGTPYKTIDGRTPKTGNKIPNSGDIIDIQGISIQRTDSDVYTYFLTWAADGQLTGVTMSVYAAGVSNGILTKKSELFGIRPLQIDTPWIQAGSNAAQQNASDLNEWLAEVMGDNEQFWSGTVNCHGDPDYQIGTYRTVQEENKEFYISSVSNNYQYNANRWDATLQVVRGRNVG